METTENNKLIAEFMGGIYIKDEMPHPYWENLPDNGQYLDTHRLKYPSSWDWLMPVVEKIEHEITPVTILDFQCRIGKTIYNKEIVNFSDESKIEAVYKTVTEFIKWYNLNKK